MQRGLRQEVLRVLPRHRCRRVSEQFCSRSPCRDAQCAPSLVPAGTSCCAPVLSRRLSSEVARCAQVAGGGAGLAARSPEPLRTNESEREDRAGPAPAGPTSLRDRDTQRGREKTRVTERQTVPRRLQTHARQRLYGFSKPISDSKPIRRAGSAGHGYLISIFSWIPPSRHSPVGSEPQGWVAHGGHWGPAEAPGAGPEGSQTNWDCFHGPQLLSPRGHVRSPP